MKQGKCLLKDLGVITLENGGIEVSRTRYEWYGSVKGFIMKYYKEGSTNTEIKKRIIENCNCVISEIAQKENGYDMIKAVQMVLLEKTHTIDGVVIVLNYSRRTIQSWISYFVYEVGRRSGF
jgi:hypothetical protein